MATVKIVPAGLVPALAEACCDPFAKWSQGLPTKRGMFALTGPYVDRSIDFCPFCGQRITYRLGSWQEEPGCNNAPHDCPEDKSCPCFAAGIESIANTPASTRWT